MYEELVDELVDSWLEQLRSEEPHPIGNEYVSGFATYMRYPGNDNIDTNRAKITVALRGVPDESLHRTFQQKIALLGGVEVVHSTMPPEGAQPDSWHLEFVNIPL